PLADLKDVKGRTTHQVLSVALMLLRACEREFPHAFPEIPVMHAAYASNLDPELAAALLRDVFTHKNGANQSLTFPPKDNAVDAAFRPLLAFEDKFIAQPRSE